MESSKNTPNTNIPRERLPGREQSSSFGTSAPSISSDAKELASEAVDRAKEVANREVSEQREKSAGEIRKLAGALHRTSDELGDTIAAPYVERAADMLDRLSSSVRDTSVTDAVRATERFARREPLLFLGGAFVVGLFAARFLKSSEQTEIEDQGFSGTGRSQW